MTKNVGDKYGDGTVTGVSTVGGHTVYTVVVKNPDSDRPVDLPQPLDVAVANANNEAERLEANRKRYEKVAKESEEATKAQENKAAEEEKAAVKASGDDKVSDDAKSKPADSKTPAPNSVPQKTAAKR